MKKKIIRDDFKILRKKSEEIKDLKKTKKLIKDLEDTLESEPLGIGLSAIQIGIPKKVSIIRTDDLNINLINPTITEKWDMKRFSDEGCLSFVGVKIETARYRTIKVKYQTLEGEEKEDVFLGMDAIMIQHEIDHQKGVLFLDKPWRKFNKK